MLIEIGKKGIFPRYHWHRQHFYSKYVLSFLLERWWWDGEPPLISDSVYNAAIHELRVHESSTPFSFQSSSPLWSVQEVHPLSVSSSVYRKRWWWWWYNQEDECVVTSSPTLLFSWWYAYSEIKMGRKRETLQLCDMMMKSGSPAQYVLPPPLLLRYSPLLKIIAIIYYAAVAVVVVVVEKAGNFRLCMISLPSFFIITFFSSRFPKKKIYTVKNSDPFFLHCQLIRQSYKAYNNQLASKARSSSPPRPRIISMLSSRKEENATKMGGLLLLSLHTFFFSGKSSEFLEMTKMKKIFLMKVLRLTYTLVWWSSPTHNIRETKSGSKNHPQPGSPIKFIVSLPSLHYITSFQLLFQQTEAPKEERTSFQA